MMIEGQFEGHTWILSLLPEQQLNVPALEKTRVFQLTRDMILFFVRPPYCIAAAITL